MICFPPCPFFCYYYSSFPFEQALASLIVFPERDGTLIDASTLITIANPGDITLVLLFPGQVFGSFTITSSTKITFSALEEISGPQGNELGTSLSVASQPLTILPMLHLS